MFMCSPGTSIHVPDEFWVGCLEPALNASIKDYYKHQDVISKESYLEDLMGCLVSFGIRSLGSTKLINSVLKLAE